MFVAKHHVTLKGRHYLPGEVIESKVPTDTAQWWLSVGAVEIIRDPPYRETTPPPPPDPSGDTDDSDGQEDVQVDSDGQKDEQVDSDEQKDVPDDSDEQKDEQVDSDEQKDEIDEAAEPPEIDVTAGIVHETEAPAEVPAKEKQKRTPRRNGGKK